MKILKGIFEKWNPKLASATLIAMFASTDRLCAKDVMEEIGNEEEVLFHKAEMASKVDLQIIEYGCVFLWNGYATCLIRVRIILLCIRKDIRENVKTTGN